MSERRFHPEELRRIEEFEHEEGYEFWDDRTLADVLDRASENALGKILHALAKKGYTTDPTTAADGESVLTINLAELDLETKLTIMRIVQNMRAEAVAARPFASTSWNTPWKEKSDMGRRKTKMVPTGRRLLRKTSWVEDEGRLVEKVEYFDDKHPEFIAYQKRLKAEARSKRTVKSYEEEQRDKEVEREKKRIRKELEELQIRRREQIECIERAEAGGVAGGEGEGPQCSKCGMFGHIKSSKQCPLYSQTQKEKDEEKKSQYNEAVKRYGTKIVLNLGLDKETKVCIGRDKLRLIERSLLEDKTMKLYW